MNTNLPTAPANLGRAQRANRGKSLELTVVASQGTTIRIEHIPSGVRWIGKGRTQPIPSPCDFMGVVCATGACIVFDAKTSALRGGFPLGNADHFPAHQRERIVRMGAAGAVAGLLVESTALGEFRWLGWRDIAACVAPSIPWADGRWVVLGANTHAIRFDRVPGVVPLRTADAGRKDGE